MNSGVNERGDHAWLMDKVYRHQRHIYDFTRKYYLVGRDRMLRELGLHAGERVVEVGCGTARNLIRMAKLYPGAELYGLDASREMLRTADGSLRAKGLKERMTLAHGYAEHMTPALFGLDAPFDRAIFSYSLSMIPDWRGALLAAARAVKADGRIHVVDFGDLSGLAPPLAGALRAWLRLFHVTPRAELLESVEKALGAAPKGLFHLKGRYAFILTASPGQIRAIASA